MIVAFRLQLIIDYILHCIKNEISRQGAEYFLLY
jgi:hypothetical protein